MNTNVLDQELQLYWQKELSNRKYCMSKRIYLRLMEDQSYLSSCEAFAPKIGQIQRLRRNIVDGAASLFVEIENAGVTSYSCH